MIFHENQSKSKPVGAPRTAEAAKWKLHWKQCEGFDASRVGHSVTSGNA